MRIRPWTFIFFSLSLLVSLGACTSDNDAATHGSLSPGVTDTKIILGSSLALTGHAGYLGTQTLRGAQAYIRHVNAKGGIHGRTIEIMAVDDSYDPPKCLANTQHFIINNEVFALFCYVGTPTTVKALPLVEEARIPLVGMFTGANALRQPFNRYVVNIRASYYQETKDAVRHMVKDLGLRKIAVFYQYDTYGFDGLIGTELALKEFNMEPVARGWYIRGTEDIDEGLDRIRASDAEAVVMVGTYDACARFINRAWEQDYTPAFYTVSFVGAEELARRIKTDMPVKVLMSQVVPAPITDPETDSDTVNEYVSFLKEYFPDDTPSFVGLEGFFNARIVVEGLRLAGRDLTREKFINAIESIRNFPLGPGMSITYGPNDRQGLEAIHFTRLQNGRFVPFYDWVGLRRELEAKP
ncbi:ABC transporter substrate-binding protein [Pseudodesulfovibrio sp. JC047]|uniref:ABC transporter substrate-binding protein n=1 Tax=Pseudodesulfovibrio sp. JC047 TaxID=2683199 RepID=UPI0013D8CF1D|nr:ABC transporter substrate-binding protein [Pseudodesulfovibrio sp. JC047]NDV18491.1 ABC transporter substrate-binding protein [Pseudodesulfovibrio sp. JC047]